LEALKVKFLGGVEAIGKSAVLVETGEARILLDYGVAIDHVPSFPMHVPPKDLDAVVLTHGHLDHCGATPILYIRGRIPVYALPATFDLAEILIKDFLRLSGYYLPYEFLDMRSMISHSVPVKYGEEVRVKDATVRFLNSGHILGSSQVVVRDKTSAVLYTSDMNTADTNLLRMADRDYGDLDAAVIESTYALEEHPVREELEKSFVARLYRVMERRGIALIPAFSVGRSQEILCVLEKYGFEYPVTVDGMAVEANEVFLKHLENLRDPELFKRALGMADWVSGWKERKAILKKPGVIVAPAGMLRGGLAVFYAERLARAPQNAIFLVSFQIPGTPGRVLQETGMFMIHGKTRKVEAEVHKFDFSSHSGMSGLHETVKNFRGSPTVFPIHGEKQSCRGLADWARENGLKTVLPRIGDTYEVPG